MTKKMVKGKQEASKKQEEKSDNLIITKTLMITEVRATRKSNAPFCIVLEKADGSNEEEEAAEENILVVDDFAARGQGIPLTFTAVGKKLICTFVGVPRTPATISRNSNILSVVSLLREERVTPFYTTCPPASRTKIYRTLILATPAESDGMRFRPAPCPFYHIAINISEEEYRACKKILPRSVFEVHFQLQT